MNEKILLEGLRKIRDSTFRNAANLRAIADDTINLYIKERAVEMFHTLSGRATSNGSSDS